MKKFKINTDRYKSRLFISPKKNIISNQITQVKKFVWHNYKELCDDRYKYHNLNHVIYVLSAVESIAKGSGLGPIDTEILKIASWFHDLGHFYTNKNHEEKSAELAKHYLQSINYQSNNLDKVISCIRATNLNTIPINILEKVIRDADLYHLGSKNYLEYSDNLFNEIRLVNMVNLKYEDWIISSIKFFKNHIYYTDYAKYKLTEQKNKNLHMLVSLLDEMEPQGFGRMTEDILG